MKKYIIGALFGFILSIGVGAHAEVVNMIGQVIDGAFNVKVNGVQLANQAIVVQGTSYLPVREFGEATGYTVGFDANLGITMTKQEVTPSPTPLPSEPPVSTTTPTPTPSKEQQIDAIKSRISMLKPRIDIDKEAIDRQPDSPLVGLWKETVAKNEAELADIQSQLDALQK